MILVRLAVVLGLLVSACSAPCACPTAADSAPPTDVAAPVERNVATIPAEHAEAAERNALLANRARGSSASVIFLGDSITERWEREGAPVWAESLASLDALNLGVGGDRTEHLLWRLRSGAYDRLPVRIAIVLIGTNNLGTGQTAEGTIDGVAVVLDDVLARWPSCKVLLQAIFPRGVHPDDPLRLAVANTNLRLRELARSRVMWLDFGRAFLAPDGSLPTTMMPDALHLSEDGYRTWAAQIRTPLH